jgi:hypothetical protein
MRERERERVSETRIVGDSGIKINVKIFMWTFFDIRGMDCIHVERVDIRKSEKIQGIVRVGEEKMKVNEDEWNAT